MNWLEIGQGKRDMMKHIINNYKNVGYYCIEPNKRVCNFLSQVCKNVKNEFAPPIFYKGNCFGVVYLSNILEHITNFRSDVFMIKEIKRVLKPQGIIIINGPDLIHWKELFWDYDYTHNFPLSKRRLETLLDDNDFKIKDFSYFTGPFSGFAATVFSSAVHLLIIFISNFQIYPLS